MIHHFTRIWASTVEFIKFVITEKHLLLKIVLLLFFKTFISWYARYISFRTANKNKKKSFQQTKVSHNMSCDRGSSTFVRACTKADDFALVHAKQQNKAKHKAAQLVAPSTGRWRWGELLTCRSVLSTMIFSVETKRSTSVLGWLSPSGAWQQTNASQSQNEATPPTIHSKRRQDSEWR